MKPNKLNKPKITKYDSFEELKSSSKTTRRLSDEEALEKALELLDFFNSLKKAKPLN